MTQCINEDLTDNERCWTAPQDFKGRSELMATLPIQLEAEVNRLRERLLDLSNRNALLNYRKSKRRTLQIIDELPDQIYQQLVLDRKHFSFEPLPDEDAVADESVAATGELVSNGRPHSIELARHEGNGAPADKRHLDDRLQTNLPEDRLEVVLREIARAAKTAIEETGVNYLYLALGLLEWREQESAERSQVAPLILIPVRLEKFFQTRTSRFDYAISWREDEIQSNLSLIRRLEKDFGLALPTFANDEDTPEAFFEAVQRAIATKPNWQVRREALVGFFSFQKLLMYLDLEPTNWAENGRLREDSLAATLIAGGTDEPPDCQLYASDYRVDEDPQASKLAIALDADSSQHSALADIAAGKNLVIEGPPGTGKSQTITNAIAIAICSGKRVLFVAEKLAALQVVAVKLNRLGMGEFCLELHSEAANPRQLFESLRKRLDASFDHPRQLESLRTELEQAKRTIADYLAATARPLGPYQEPMYETMWRTVDLRSQGYNTLRNAHCDKDLQKAEFEANSQLLASFAERLAEVGDAKQSPWWGFWPSRLNPNDCQPVAESLDALRAVSEEVEKTLSHMREDYGPAAVPWVVQCTPERESVLASLVSKSTNLAAPHQLKVLVSPELRAKATEIVELLGSVRQLDSAARDFVRGDPLAVVDHAKELGELIQKRLATLGPITIAQALQLRARFDEFARVLGEVTKIAKQLEAEGHEPIHCLQDYERVENVFRLLRHPALEEQNKLPLGLFRAVAVDVVKRASATSAELTERGNHFSHTFHLPSIPNVAELRELTKKLRVYAVDWLHWFRPDYRKCRRELATFTHPTIGRSLSAWVGDLGALEGWLTDRETFAKDEECLKTLGSEFRGQDTDWERIKLLRRWVATAQNFGLDQARAQKLFELRGRTSLRGSEVVQARKSLIAEADKLQALKRLAVTTSLELTSFTTVIQSAEKLQADLASLETLLQGFAIPHSATLSEVVNHCDELVKYVHATSRVEQVAEWGDLCEWYGGLATNADSLSSAIDWMTTLISLGLPEEVLARVLTEDPPARCQSICDAVVQVREGQERWKKERASLSEFGRAAHYWLVLFDRNSCEVVGLKSVEQLIGNISKLPAWAALGRLVTTCEESGLADFTTAAFEGKLAVADLASCYRLTVLERVCEAVISQESRLRSFSRTTLENARHRFKELDRELLRLNQRLISHESSKCSPPAGNSRGRVAEYTELGLVRHEIGKQKRHCRIRDLMQRAGNAVQALKPCFMMSPLAVAQFLDPKIEFDLVVMDEASQIKPEDALGTILRAKQLVVVGDPKQLPPTSFFDRMQDDVDDSEAVAFDNTESILEVATKTFQPIRRLNWHYRSCHESLIQFSNDRFYDNQLVVFPAASRERENLGVRHHFVEDGVFSAGANLAEAGQVARAIVRHAQACPTESLGVGAFNLKQASVIQDCLDKLCEDDPIARAAVDKLNEGSERLFVKNLENLQGDERDVIFISYTYGPESASGRVMNRFGPITSATGWRRLNVLITRARRRVEVFSSMKPSDIHVRSDVSRGIAAFRDYLEFSQTGRLPERVSIPGRPFDSPFEETVARVVSRLGLKVIPQVGVAGYFVDLGVLRPNSETDFLLGIECDGASYHSSLSARDRDRLREDVIRARGWQIHRIWSTEWYMNQQYEEERLLAALKQQLERAT